MWCLNMFHRNLQLHALSVFVVTSSEVRLRLLYSALKRQKPANFPTAKPNLSRKFYIAPKYCRSASWRTNSLLMIRRPPRSTQYVSSAASDVYKRQVPRFRRVKNGISTQGQQRGHLCSSSPTGPAWVGVTEHQQARDDGWRRRMTPSS